MFLREWKAQEMLVINGSVLLVLMDITDFKWKNNQLKNNYW